MMVGSKDKDLVAKILDEGVVAHVAAGNKLGAWIGWSSLGFWMVH